MAKVDLNQRSTTREQVLFALVLVVMVVVFLKGLYAPQLRKVESLKGKILSLTLQRDALKKFAMLSPEKVRSLSRRKGVKIKILSGELTPAYQDLTSLLAELTRPAVLSGVSVQYLSYQPSAQEEGYMRTDFAINVRGSFTDVLNYVERMEQFPALFHLEGVSLKIIEEQPQEVESEIQGRFYRLGTGGGKRPPLATTVEGGKTP